MADRAIQPYRQAISALELTLERGTPNVPQDGYYYVLLKGQLRGRFRNFKQAHAEYKAILHESGYVPAPPEAPGRDAVPEAVRRYMDELEEYWLNSHKYKRRGGKTMYRG